MNLELNQFSATLAAGAYFLIVLALVFEVAFPGLIRREAGQSRGLPLSVLAVVLAFAIGIVLERLSDLVAEPGYFGNLILDADPAIRKEVFNKGFVEEYAAWPHVLDALGGRNSANISSQLYYEAKSAANEVPTYFDDLVLIQTHIRFIRSFAVISAIGLAGIMLVSAARLLCWVLRLGFTLPWTCPASGQARVRWCDVLKVGGIAFVLAICWGAARTAFVEEEVNFDKRVYGYYLHLLREGRAGVGLKPALATVSNAQKHVVQLRPEDYVQAAGAGFPASFGSGLAYAGRNGAVHEFLMLTDRGPTYDGPALGSAGETTILLDPGFTPRLARVRWQPGSDPLAVETIPLSFNWQSAVGVPVRITDGETVIQLSGDGSEARVAEPSDRGIDPEGVAIDADGDGFWICDEYRPAVFRVNGTGVLSSPLTLENGGLPASFRNHEPNRGLESIDVSAGMLFVALQSACAVEGPGGSKAHEPFIRIARCRMDEAKSAIATGKPLVWDEFAYAVPAAYGDRFSDCMISDIHALSDDVVLVIERHKDGARRRWLVCAIDLAKTERRDPAAPPYVDRVPIVNLGDYAGWQ